MFLQFPSGYMRQVGVLPGIASTPMGPVTSAPCRPVSKKRLVCPSAWLYQLCEGSLEAGRFRAHGRALSWGSPRNLSPASHPWLSPGEEDAV